MEQQNTDFLDLSKNKLFIIDVMCGDEEKFSQLSSWYNKQKILNNINDNQTVIFDIILNVYNNSKNKKYEIEQLKRKNIELEMINNNTDDSLIDSLFAKFTEIEVKNETNKKEQKNKQEKEVSKEDETYSYYEKDKLKATNS